jgi:ubiquinone/menaquinone biosynthesis C-methylase UbiE
MKGQSTRTDTWASGESYQHYVGRWSRLVAAEFIVWLGAPSQQRWLDIGCGTGALSQVILDLASPAAVQGIDPSQSHITFARETIHDERITFVVGITKIRHFPLDTTDQ